MKTAPILGLMLLTLLTACGKAGAPQVPGSSFPRNYPDPSLAPTAPVRAAPEDQAGLKGDDSKPKFTEKGSYIDPSVRATELSRGAVLPGSTLPYAQSRSSDGGNTPFTQSIGTSATSPLPADPAPPPSDEPPKEPPARETPPQETPPQEMSL